MTEDIIAEVVGCDTCHAEGLTVRGFAPVLAMCRLLVEMGYEPDRPLLAFRGSELAMSIKTLRAGAAAPQGVQFNARIPPKDREQVNGPRRKAGRRVSELVPDPLQGSGVRHGEPEPR